MSKTKTQIKEHCAEILGLKTVGQDITQPWTVKLDHFWDSTYDEIKSENLNTFKSTGPVPARLYHHMAMIMAEMGKISASVSEERYARIERGQDKAWREFRKFATDRHEDISGPRDF